MASVGFDGGSRRGQLLLAGAFVLAVALIGLTIVLTSSSYTTTLASQENDIVSGNDAVSVREAVATDLTRQFEYVFDNYGHGNRRAPFEAAVSQVGNETVTHYARRGRMVNATMTPTGAEFIEGTRIKQGDTTDLEHPNSNDPDWKPATNVELRNATFVISGLSETDPQKAFNLSLDTPADAGKNWSVVFYSDSSSGRFTVRSQSPTGELRRCTRPDVRASGVSYEVDIDAGTIDGTPCDALQFIDPGRHKYDINITNGDHASGRYWMIVDKEPSSSDVESYSIGLIDARTNRVLYGARVEYRYHSATVSYETNLDIAHREIS